MAMTDLRPAVNGRVIGVGLGRSRFVGGRGVALLALAALAPSLLPAGAAAAPEGAAVSSGSATIVQRGQTTVIRASNGAVIDYRSFDVGAGEKVRFVQPGADARVLNRINSDMPTRIDGMIRSNGVVYFANRAGVIFGQGAVLNVGGIVAAAGRISDRDFASGIDRFTDLKGEVVNAGSIDAKFAALIGQRVSNSGVINAPAGVIAMVAGDEVVLTERGGTMSVRVAPGAAPGSAGGVGVSNSGAANAEGGRALMAAGDMYSLALRNTGTVRAADIRLDGRGAANVRVSGTLDASNQSGPLKARGGSVTVTGERINVAGATIDASGKRGGGSVRIGGDFQGSGDLAHAAAVTVDQQTRVSADATNKGDGGRVIVWSDGATKFYGAASADAGARGGDGGLIETSGKTLDVRSAQVNARARAAGGAAGSWLMDPTDVVIDAAPTAGGAFGGGDPDVFTPDASVSPAVVDVATVNTTLSLGTSVTVQTASAGTDPGNITVMAPIAKTGGGPATLTLDAAGSIAVNQAIGSTVGPLGVTLSAGGAVTISAPVTTNGGTFSSFGVAFTVAPGGSITTLGGDIALTHSGLVSVAGAIDADATSASSILIRGSSLVATLPVTSGSGGITLRPDDPASAININNGAGGFEVAGATLANLVIPAGGRLTIGLLGGTGAIGIGSGGPVDLSAADIDLTINGGATTINGPLTLAATRALRFSVAGISNTNAGVDVTAGTLGIGSSAGVTLDADVAAIDSSSVFGGGLTLTNARTGATTVGDLNVTGDLSLTTASTSAITTGILTVGGDATLSNVGSLTVGVGSQVDGDLSVTSTMGNVTLPTMTVGGGGLVLNAQGANSQVITGTITGPVMGATTFQVTTVGAGSIALVDAAGDAVISAAIPGTLTFVGGGNVAVNAGTPLTLGASTAVGAITVNAPTLSSAALTAGTGITLLPHSTADSVGVDAPTAVFNITTAQLQLMNPGAGQTVTIGHSTGTGAVVVGSAAAIDLSAQGYNLTLRGGATTFNQTLTLANDATLTLRAAGITGQASGTDVVIGGAAGAIAINSTAGATLTTDVDAISITGPSLFVTNAGALAVTGSTGSLVVIAGGDVSVTNAQALNAAINANAGASAIDITNTGTLTVGVGNGLRGSTVSVAASDLVLDGIINASTSATITRDTAGTIGVGTGATGDLFISSAELARITAPTLTIGSAAVTRIEVGAVQATDFANITGLVSLRALAAGGDVAFLNVTSGFKALDVQAADTITFPADYVLSTDGPGNGAITLTAPGGITGAGALTLDAETDLTVNHDLTTAGELTMRAQAGTITVAAGADVTTTNNRAILEATGLDLAGTLSSGTAATIIARTTAGDISLGTTAGGMEISAAELGRITATGLFIGDADTTLLRAADVGVGATGNITGNLTLLAGDFDLSGPINSDDARLVLARATPGIIFVGAGATPTISNAELAQITAPSLQIGGDSTDQVVVTGVTEPSTAGIAGLVTIASTASVTFASPGESVFKTLAVNTAAANVNADVRTTVGDLTFTLTGTAPAARINLSAGRTLTAARDLTLTAPGGAVASGALTLRAERDIVLNNNVTTAGTLTADAARTLTVGSSSALVSGGNPVNILAGDLDLLGTINAGAGAVSIARRSAGGPGFGGTIGLGTATGQSMTISNAELGRVQSTGLTIGNANTTGITVSGVDAASSNGVSGVTSLVAGRGAITFAGGASTFNALSAAAAGAINVVSTLTTDSGALTFNSDTDSSGAEKIILTNNVRAFFRPSPTAAPTNAFAIDFMDAVSLAGDVRISGKNVTFHAGVDSNTTPRALSVQTYLDGITDFRGDVGTLSPLRSLFTDPGAVNTAGVRTTDPDGITRVRGRLVAGRFIFSDVVRVVDDAVIESTGAAATDGVYFNNRVESANSGPPGPVVTPKRLTVLVNRGGPADRTSLPVISFAAPVGSVDPLRDLYLNANAAGTAAPRAYVPRVATIVARPRNAAGDPIPTPGNVAIPITLTGSFVMGQNEKFTAVGNLVLAAPFLAALGDITTTGNLFVTSNDIALNTRAPATNVTFSGETFSQADNGLDYAVNGGVSFSTPPRLVGSGEAPTFGTPTGDDGNLGPVNLDQLFTFNKFDTPDTRATNAITAADVNLTRGGVITTLDLTSTGTPNTGLANNLAGAIPRETRQNDVGTDATITAAQRKEIESLDISPRDVSASEFRDLLAGAATYDDLGTATGAPTGKSVKTRFTSPLVASVLESYDALTRLGEPVALKRTVALALERAQQEPDAGDAVDVGAFRRYLQNNPDEAEARAIIDNLDELFLRLDRLGLPPRDLARVKANLASRFLPTAIARPFVQTGVVAAAGR